MARTLYCLTNDLRLDDNPAFHNALHDDALFLVYCLDPRLLQPASYQLPAMSEKRLAFLHQTLTDLENSLSDYDQHIKITLAPMHESIPVLCDKLSIDRVILSTPIGFNEQQQLEQLRVTCDKIQVDAIDTYTLFDRSLLNQLNQPLDRGYTPFKQCALTNINSTNLPLPRPKALPKGFQKQTWPMLLTQAIMDLRVSGGETAAQSHIAQYFASDCPQTYKTTRNQLAGFSASSKCSFWLSTGALSVKRLLKHIVDYQQHTDDNSSTDWLILELLWREYFQWLSVDLGKKLFQFQGIAKTKPLTGFYPERFKKWCEGTTPYPLVNACMQELQQTGYLSNRGRQIAASCLVNELAVDWRYGAAWFQYQLLDYDVGSNWGNWQYIAGVGVDPRGGRHFNLDKQTQQFDPDGTYQATWLTKNTASSPVLDSRDIVDWPIDSTAHDKH